VLHLEAGHSVRERCVGGCVCGVYGVIKLSTAQLLPLWWTTVVCCRMAYMVMTFVEVRMLAS
jgi:hypothetical protein